MSSSWRESSERLSLRISETSSGSVGVRGEGEGEGGRGVRGGSGQGGVLGVDSRALFIGELIFMEGFFARGGLKFLSRDNFYGLRPGELR